MRSVPHKAHPQTPFLAGAARRQTKAAVVKHYNSKSQRRIGLGKCFKVRYISTPSVKKSSVGKPFPAGMYTPVIILPLGAGKAIF